MEGKLSVVKEAHFYYAHRNETLPKGDKCTRLHGHVGKVIISVEAPYNEDSGVTVLFSDVENILCKFTKWFDHNTLLHSKDPYCEVFDDAEIPYVKLPFVTSAENIAMFIINSFNEECQANKLSWKAFEIEYKETESSTIIFKL